MKPSIKTLLIGRWTWYRPLVSLVTIYVLMAIFAVFFADRLIFLPPSPSYERSEPNLVFFETSAGESIAALYFPAADGRPTLLHSHGNAEDIGLSRGLYEIWHRAGLGVLAYDYPGYGQSSGVVGEAGTNRAALASWDYLTKNLDVEAGGIVIVGHSVGSGPACFLAAEVDAGGLVLISPFTSTYAVHVPSWLFPRDRFQNLRLMPEISERLLVIHGEEDTLISAKHGKRLYEASPAEVKIWHPVAGAGHNDLFQVGDDLPEVIADFAKRVAPALR